MRRTRLVSLTLSVGWLIPCLIAVHAGWAVVVPPIVGAAFLELAAAKRPRGVVAGGLVVALGLGFLLGHVWGTIAAGWAAWAGWASWDPTPRTGLVTRLVLVLLALSAVVIRFPHWWPVLPVALGMGVLGLVEGQRSLHVSRRPWWGLAMAVILMAAGLALVVFSVAPLASGRIPLLPCTVGPGGSWSAHCTPGSGPSEPPRGPLYRGGGPVHHLTHPVFGRPLGILRQLGSATRHATGGPPTLWLTLVGGVTLLGAGFWLRRRMLRDWEPEDERGPSPGRVLLERRPVTVSPDAPSALRHTRRVIYQQLRHAAGRPYAARPGETVREWARRVFDEAALSAVQLYEEVRYGDAADSAERATQTAEGWPPRPKGGEKRPRP